MLLHRAAHALRAQQVTVCQLPASAPGGGFRRAFRRSGGGLSGGERSGARGQPQELVGETGVQASSGEQTIGEMSGKAIGGQSQQMIGEKGIQGSGGEHTVGKMSGKAISGQPQQTIGETGVQASGGTHTIGETSVKASGETPQTIGETSAASGSEAHPARYSDTFVDEFLVDPEEFCRKQREKPLRQQFIDRAEESCRAAVSVGFRFGPRPPWRQREPEQCPAPEQGSP